MAPCPSSTAADSSSRTRPPERGAAPSKLTLCLPADIVAPAASLSCPPHKHCQPLLQPVFYHSTCAPTARIPAPRVRNAWRSRGAHDRFTSRAGRTTPAKWRLNPSERQARQNCGRRSADCKKRCASATPARLRAAPRQLDNAPSRQTLGCGSRAPLPPPRRCRCRACSTGWARYMPPT